MPKPLDLTETARTGYMGNPNPHLYSSPSFYAHALGRYFHDTGRSNPINVAMGRGYRIRANGMLFRIGDGETKGTVRFERTE